MLYGPDCSSSDEEGFSDDNDYYEFKERMRKQQNEQRMKLMVTQADQEKQKLQTIMSAISFDKNETVIEELDKGLKVDVDLDLGWTPLLLAASVANDTIMSELLKRGADVNQNRDSLTPLMLVCNNSSEDETVKDRIIACIKLLLDNGATVNAIDRKRKTAIMLAAYNGHLEAVKLLLPHVDKEAEDNQRWTALFWAVEGHKTVIVKLLLKEGFDCEKVDIRGNTVADIAHSNGYEDILTLLPKDPYNDEFYVHLNNSNSNFINTFNNLSKEEKPQLFVDICKILYGTRSENFVSIFNEKNVSLYDLLSTSDSKLKEIGIQLPYQRNRIMGGIFKLHKHPFHAKSIPFVKKNALYTNIDVSSTVLSCVKQLIMMEASLKFIIENYEGNLDPLETKEIKTLIAKNRNQINRLKSVTNQFVKETATWDATLKPVDKITKKRWNVPWCNLWISVGLSATAILIILLRFK